MDMDVATLSRQMATEELTALDLTRDCIARITAQNPRLHAVAALFTAEALVRAAFLDAERAAGRILGPLHGIPVLVKELVDIEGLVTRHGSLCYGTAPAIRDAPLVTRLRDAGAIILGTTHMVEFAMGSWGTNAARGTPLNPAGGRRDWYAGGSSSGSAVAVAAGLVPLAIGSDTGGSVRIPASICGVVGYKPSFGLIPVEGVAPLAPSFDTIGVLANSIADARLACEVMAGQPLPGSAPLPERLTIAAVAEADLAPVDPEVMAMLRDVMHRLETTGHRITPAVLPRSLAGLQELNGTIVAHEAWRAFRRQVEDSATPMDPHVRKRVLAGKAISETAYLGSLDEMAEMTRAFREGLSGIDAILLPGTPVPAAELDRVDEAEIPLSRYTRLANCLDLCGIALPVDRTAEGAPLGIQLLAPAGQDARLLDIAACLPCGTPHRAGGS